jgi:hypothetical protein
MGDAARKRASVYDIGRLADDVDRLYRELLGESGRGRRALSSTSTSRVKRTVRA